MNDIYACGLTHGTITYSDQGPIIHFTIVTHRLARLILRMSAIDKWERPVSGFTRFLVKHPIYLVGFQAWTGDFIAIWGDPKLMG